MIVAGSQIIVGLIFPFKHICEKFYKKIIPFINEKNLRIPIKTVTAAFFNAIFDSTLISDDWKTSFIVIQNIIEVDNNDLLKN